MIGFKTNYFAKFNILGSQDSYIDLSQIIKM